MVKKIGLFSIAMLLFAACKTKQVVAESAASNELSATTVIDKHYKNATNFSTLNIRTSVKYSDKKQSHSISADVRIEKDKQVWISAKMLGFPIAKAKITPSRVSYYEVINNTYFDGNYDLLSNWLGTDLDYNKVQNLFIGEALDDLTQEKFIASIVEGMYKLEQKNKATTEKEFYFEAANFLIKKEYISQPQENRSLTINYPEFTKHEKMFLPNEIFIEANQKDNVKIEIQYKNVTFDENLNTPFSIPSGYEEVKIN